MREPVTCLVRGPGSRYPRGFLLLIPFWFVVAAGACLLVTRHFSSARQPPLWFEASEVAALFVAAWTAFFVVAFARHRAFYADDAGIRIGVATQRRQPRLRVVAFSWQQVASVGMVRRRYGALAEVTLRPGAALVSRPSLAAQAVLLAFTLVFPWLGRGYPALTRPRRLNPVRYRFRVAAADASAAVAAVAALAPVPVMVRLVSGRSALRYLATVPVLVPPDGAGPWTVAAPEAAVPPPTVVLPAVATPAVQLPEPPAVHA